MLSTGSLIAGYFYVQMMCRGTSTKKRRVFVRENPIKMDDDWRYPYDLGNLHLSDQIYEA